MALDKVLIGARIRKIREELFCESRVDFARRCNLTERHIGQLERGEFLISLPSLDNIILQQVLTQILFYMEKVRMID